MRHKNLMQQKIETMRLADFVNHLSVLPSDNKTILNKDFSLTQVIKLVGINTQNMSEDDAEKILNARIKAYLTPTKGVKMKIFIDRREIKKKVYNQNFKSIHHQKFYECQIDDHATDFTTDIYITITLYPNQKIKDVEALQLYARRHLEELNSEVDKFIVKLKEYNPFVLSTQENKQENLLDFLSKRLNYTTRLSRPKSQKNIADTMQLTDIELNEETGVIKFIQDEDVSVGCLCKLNCYPDVTYQDVLDDISGLKYKFSIIQNVEYLDDESFIAKLSKKLATMLSLVETVVLQVFQLESIYANDIEQYKQSIAMVGSKETRFVKHSLQVLIYADDEEELQSSYKSIKNTLRINNIEISKETYNLHNAFFAQMIGFEQLNDQRERYIAVHNLANYGSLSAVTEGSSVCVWGNRPVCQFPTKTNTKYNFTFHETEEKASAGSTVIIGQSGSGKTTLAAKLLLDCLTFGKDDNFKNEFKALVFDAGRGLAPQIKAAGGLYIDLADPKALPMNPFLLAKNEKDTENIKFLIDWIIVLAGGKDNLKETELTAIDKAVREVLKLPLQYRKLSVMTPVLEQNVHYKDDEVTLFEKLKRWMLIDGDEDNAPLHAQYFNADKDALDFDNQIVAFDMESLLKGNDEILIPVMMYIVHSYQLYLKRNPSPFKIYIDEAHTYLKNKIGASFIENTILKARKEFGIVELLTQTVGHILECDERVGKSIAQNISTKIFFANPDANIEELKTFGCNDSEIEWITNSGEPRTILVKKKGQQSVVLDVDFSSYGEYLHLITGNTKDIFYINDFLDKYDYEEAISKYIRKKDYEMKRGY